MKIKNEVIIVGGGLAGLTAGIHLSKIGISVTIIEKNEFPKHKVCGEYISNEVLPYLEWLEIGLAELKPTYISKLQFSTASGKTMQAKLPLGGFGISRYALDFLLYQKAIENGCIVIKDTVENIVFENDEFEVATANNSIFKTKIILGAFGKRSNIDQKMQRSFIQKKSPWLAVKAHYIGDFPYDLVGLHNFEGGYCGVSKVENNRINICYLVEYEAFKEYKNIADFQNLVLKQNPHLNSIFENCKMLFEKPLTISQISFEKKLPVEKHVLMIGDSGGLIHPLCGNGMAMAIHSAKIVSELVISYIKNEIQTREEFEKKYIKTWNYNFESRLKTGKLLSKIFFKPKLAEALMNLLIIFPLLLNGIIKRTHGKPIKMEH